MEVSLYAYKDNINTETLSLPLNTEHSINSTTVQRLNVNRLTLCKSMVVGT